MNRTYTPTLTASQAYHRARAATARALVYAVTIGAFTALLLADWSRHDGFLRFTAAFIKALAQQ